MRKLLLTVALLVLGGLFGYRLVFPVGRYQLVDAGGVRFVVDTVTGEYGLHEELRK